MNVSGKRMMDISNSSDIDANKSGISSLIQSDRRTFHYGAANNASLLSKHEMDVEPDVLLENKLDEIQRALIGQHSYNTVMYHKHDNGLRESGRMMLDRGNGEKGEMEGLLTAQKIDFDAMSCLNPGSSNLLSATIYDYGTAARNGNYEDGLNKNNVDHIKDNRAVLLQKLDEIKDEISWSGNLMDRSKEEVALHRRTAQKDCYVYENQYPGKKLQMDRVMIQEFYTDSQFNSPSYQNQYANPTHLMRRQEMRGNGFYSPRYRPSDSQGYGDSTSAHFYRRGQPHGSMSGTYMDHMEPSPQIYDSPHTSCPCYDCLRKRQVPAAILPTAYSGESNYASRYYNNGSSSSLLRSHETQPHKRWHSDVSSEVDGSIYRHSQKANLASSGIHYRPIAGGSPFLTCYNCFELLMLPEVLLINNDNRKKIICGACSLVILLTVSSKSLVVEAESDHVKVDKKPDDYDYDYDYDYDHHVKVDEKCDDRHLNQVRTTFSSDDDPGHGFRSSARQNEYGEIKIRSSTPTHSSELKVDRGELTAKKKDPVLVDLSSKDKVSPPLPAGSSLQDYFEYSNKFHRAKPSAEANRNERSKPEKMAAIKDTNEPTSLNESSATEIELSSYEYSNTRTTSDSVEGSREGEHLKASKRADSFFASFLKKTFKDSYRESESFDCEKANVTVNGHLIPDRLIKKAEKLAGPIHPGHYWYDFRAGFWGVIGGPCLGIIPPFIEVFNYPMVESCSGGNTEVFVNGRELHQKDLNILSSRGLRTERNRSYIIEISGRIIDEETREELPTLGKLAPNVERAKRGFGMKPQ